jgi:hypothetical protein
MSKLINKKSAPVNARNVVASRAKTLSPRDRVVAAPSAAQRREAARLEAARVEAQRLAQAEAERLEARRIKTERDKAWRARRRAAKALETQQAARRAPAARVAPSAPAAQPAARVSPQLSLSGLNISKTQLIATLEVHYAAAVARKDVSRARAMSNALQLAKLLA